jgi:hypothetical protein
MSNREFGVSALGWFLGRDPTETSGRPRAATEIPASRYARQPIVLRS